MICDRHPINGSGLNDVAYDLMLIRSQYRRQKDFKSADIIRDSFEGLVKFEDMDNLGHHYNYDLDIYKCYKKGFEFLANMSSSLRVKFNDAISKLKDGSMYEGLGPL